uniref:BTB domain-containing protein n=1 Tax=Moniliophthora roreri TaxID=221103 RepID=A0A0W0EZH2_MONRR
MNEEVIPLYQTTVTTITTSPSNQQSFLSDKSNSPPVEIELTLAEPPFDDTLGVPSDVSIRTSDNITFRAHRAILSLASPFFRTMLSLPQPSDSESNTDADTIPVSEDSKTIRSLLLLCYPGPRPTFVSESTDLTEIKALIGALTKYEMLHTGIAGRLKDLIHQPFTCKEPLRIYAIACQFKWQDLAETAAKASLQYPLHEIYVAELEEISAGDYHRLLKYHRQCGVAAGNVTTNCGLRWMSMRSGLGAWTWLRCQSCPAAGSVFICLTDAAAIPTPVPVRAWFMDYMVAMGTTLKRTPCAKLLDNMDTILPFIPKIGQCTTCRAGAFVELRSFIPGIFKAEVEKAISQVELEISF